MDINNIGKAEIYDELKPFFARIANQNAEKEKTEKIRREFTANVSHELKTPLTTISGYAQMISNGMAKTEDIKAVSYTHLRLQDAHCINIAETLHPLLCGKVVKNDIC